MNAETIVTLIVGLFGGGVLKSGVDWLRNKGKDRADALTVTLPLLKQWIQDASNAEQKIVQLIRESGAKDVELREALNAVNLCKKSLERCRERHGCGE